MILQCIVFQNRVLIIGWTELTEATRKEILKCVQSETAEISVVGECTSLIIYGNTGKILIALNKRHKLLVC